MSVNDRGTIKWTAMMLPEHINMLNEYWKEEEYKEKPMLDEQQKEEIGMKLQCAIHNNLTVEIKHYSGRDYLTIKGKLMKIDQIKLKLNNEDQTEIKLDNVLDVHID
ncbi:hypothetical protein CFK37_19175 [Virgibacillus phasianinus]|uniref:YolD-like family protein n=1 Tax=Virgibacillus phasianinus TaxID=2017483 RepID=A0A220U818_9BACI|nr:YolD-like family protein [Virgibacillus phasianinus]ASK64122.1 hypothetical protein CFK37_19175 [Virgibacillus phasianinus]